MKNRLKLDFALTTAEDRSQYIENYINSPEFPHDPTPHELETIGDYLLWGQDANGHDSSYGGFIHLDTKWNQPPANLASLDELLESPTFDENLIKDSNSPVYKAPRLTFSRSEARANAPDHLKPIFEDLWRRIDETDLIVEAYELEHGRRTTPIRDTLIAKFTPEEIDSFFAEAKRISQHTYLRKKHQLVDLRREQYTLRDSYQPPRDTNPTPSQDTPHEFQFGAEFGIKPLSLSYN